jgi:hypothetical protein
MSQNHANPSSNHDGPKASEEIPLGQRLLDSPFLLLAAGMVTMIVFYTAWGVIETVTLPKSLLP